MQVNPENMLSERGQSQKATDCTVPFTQVYNREMYRNKMGVTAARGQGRERVRSDDSSWVWAFFLG